MKQLDKNTVTGLSALLVHAACIDENYSENEKKLVKEFIKSYLNDVNVDEVLKKAEEIEKNSNQILDFTKEIKMMEEKDKIKIIKTLWKIIFSNKEADIYETNLMSRLAGLLYIDKKVMGEIKEQIKKENL